MVELITGSVLPYIIAAVTFVLGLLTYGRVQRKAGRRDVEREVGAADIGTALETKEKLDAVHHANADRDVVERLREQGRLREDDPDDVVQGAAGERPNRRTRRH